MYNVNIMYRIQITISPHKDTERFDVLADYRGLTVIL